MSIFEITMLVCFGLSWPISIVKSWRSRQNGGKSLFFLIVVIIGYMGGILHKLIYANDFVTILYFINMFMVMTDAAIYLRNMKLEKKLK